MELLIALFGLIIYTCVIVVGKAQSKAFDCEVNAKMSWQQERQNAWLSKVYSIAAVHEARETATSSTWVRILAKAYVQLPSFHDLTESQAMDVIYQERSRNKKNNQEYHKCLMWILAQQGKILRDWDCPTDFTFSPAYTEREKLMWDRQYEFAMLLLREVRKFAPDSRMIFTTPLETDNNVSVCDADRDVEKFRYKVGSVRWIHLTYFDSDLQYHL